MLGLQKGKGEATRPGLYVTVRGDSSVLTHLNLRLVMTIIVQKPFVTSIPIHPIFPNDPRPLDSFIRPLVDIEVVGEPQKEAIVKNRYAFKENTMYIYYPSDIPVDERVNKIFLNSYQTLMKEVPRAFKGAFAKLIFFEQGTGDYSLEQQGVKCSDVLTALFKISIEKRIDTYSRETTIQRYNQLNIKTLLGIFKSKLGLAQLYRRIGVDDKAQEILELLWQDMLYNQKFFTDGTITQRQSIYLPPFLERNYHQMVKDFENPANFLKVCAFAFLRSYEMELELNNYTKALRNLKKFLEFSHQNVFNGLKSRQQFIRNIWVIALIDETYDIGHRLSRAYPTFLNSAREQQYHSAAVQIARIYRNSVEKVGHLLYSYRPNALYPGTPKQEIDYCLEMLTKSKEWSEFAPTEECKAYEQPVEQNMLLAVGGADSFKVIYLKSLIRMHEILNRSPFHRRNARAIRLLLLKLYIAVPQLHRFRFDKEATAKYSAVDNPLPYIERILKKAERIAFYEEQESTRPESLRRTFKTDDQDSILHRNREDQVFWPSLKFLEDYYKFILLLISLRNQRLQTTQQQSLSLSFSRISNSIQLRTDNVMPMLLAGDLMSLEKAWEETVGLVRELFALERGEEHSLANNQNIGVRMGILLEASIVEGATGEHLRVRLNNRQLMCLEGLGVQWSKVGMRLLVTDRNNAERCLGVHFLGLTLCKEGMLQLNLRVECESCLIFMIREVQVRMGGLTAYYVNKTLEMEEVRKLEAEDESRSDKRKTRRYSSFELNVIGDQDMLLGAHMGSSLAHTFLQLHTFNLSCPKAQQAADTPVRGGGSSSHSSSLYSLIRDKPETITLHYGIWTPVFLLLKAYEYHPGTKLLIPLSSIAVEVSEKDESSGWIRIGDQWGQLGGQGQLSVNSTAQSGIEVLLLVRCGGFARPKAKPRKGSVMSRSGMSSNASWGQNEMVHVQMQIVQDEFKYSLSHNISYVRKEPFDVKYYYSNQLQQFTITNITEMPLVVKQEDQEILLMPQEEGRVENGLVEVRVNSDHLEQGKGPNISSEVQLERQVKKQLLKPEKLETCRISLAAGTILRAFAVLKIRGDVTGHVAVLNPGSGFELLGMVEGELSVQPDGNLNIYLLPTRTGQLVLPSLLIDGRKALWDRTLLTIPQES